MKYMLPHLKSYRLQFIIGPLFKLLEAVLELTMPLYMAKIVDIGIPSGDRGYILKMGGLMLLTATVGLCSAIVCQYSASVASQGFGTSLRDGLFQKVLGLSFSQVESFGVGTLTNRITNDVNQLQLAVAMSIRLVIRAPFICIGSVVATLLIDWKLGLIVLTSLPVFSAALYFVMRATFPLYTRVQARLDAVGAKVRELLSGVRIIRAFATEERETADFRQKDDELARAAARVGALSSAFNPVTSLIMNVTIIAIIWFGGFRVYDGALTSGEILAFISYVTQMLTVLIVLANLVVIMTRAAASLRRVSEVLALPDDPTEAAFGESVLPDGDTAVEFRHVSFGYHAGSDQVFEDVNFKIKKGESVGIIGVTGSGKSTLCHLISRYYLPDSGEVLLFGKNVADYSAGLLRRVIGVVPQKIQLFSGTVAEKSPLRPVGGDRRRAAPRGADCAGGRFYLEASKGVRQPRFQGGRGIFGRTAAAAGGGQGGCGRSGSADSGRRLLRAGLRDRPRFAPRDRGGDGGYHDHRGLSADSFGYVA